MRIKNISTDKAPSAIGPYSQAIAANGMLFCSGQISLDPVSGEMKGENAEQQTEQVMCNIKGLLEAAGSSMEKVLKTTIFLVDMNDFTTVNAVYANHFGTHKPARSTVAVAALPKNALIEIEVTALQ